RDAMALTPASVADARALLVDLGAPPRLLVHGELVGEAAETLLAEVRRLGLPVDEELVRAGVVLHDAGKILHPEEFERGGAEHEPAGQPLLLAHGVSPEIARTCLSHARWRSMSVSVEELLVALADKLWKGARNPELEQAVIDRIATVLGKGRWDLFVELDNVF